MLDIWNYTCKNWGIEQADRYLDLLHDGCNRIADDEAFVTAFEKMHPDLRSSHCEHHYIFYLDYDNPLIIAVLHEKMDLIERVMGRIPQQ